MEMVTMKNHDVFTDSMVIAEGTGNDHQSITKLIRKYKKDFLVLGSVEFTDLKSINPKGGRPTRVYRLDETQASLLITFLDNTETVRKFKLELVRQFYAMRQLLM